MTYTVYIPDAERGPTSYTQRQFDTIKALARWAVAAALEEPVVVTPPPTTRAPEITQILADIEAATAPVEKYKSHLSNPTVFTAYSLPHDARGTEFAKAANKRVAETDAIHKEVEKQVLTGTKKAATPPPLPVWDVDTDEWFTDVSASEWAAPLRERKWYTVAHLYFAEINRLFTYKMLHERDSAFNTPLSVTDRDWFWRLARRWPQYFAENLFPETQVRWDLLPGEFDVGCGEWELNNKNNHAYRFMTPTHQFVKDAFALLKFLREGQRHVSWKDVSVGVEEGLAWGAAAAPATAEKLLTAWWSGGKPTDAVREFVLRAVVMRYFKQTEPASSVVGSQEFLTTYMDSVRQMGVDGVLPAGFLDWATRGTAFKHCKAVLSDMGIASVRRADGQKYTNLAEIKDVGSETWVFEDDLADVGDGFAAFDESALVWEGGLAAFVSDSHRIEIVADPHGRG